MPSSRMSGSHGRRSEPGLGRRPFDQYGVHHTVLAWAGRDPGESDLRQDRRPAGDDVPGHEVRIRRVGLHRDDLDLLRHGGAAVQYVRELGAQHPYLPVRPLGPIQLESLRTDERVLLLAADLAAALFTDWTVASTGGLAPRPTLP